MRKLLPIYFILMGLQAFAQPGPYPAAAEKWGSTAVPADTSLIVRWADQCSVVRGYLDMSDKSLGRVSHGWDSLALGMADNQVVSLGDSGVATFYFDPPISDVPGMDLAIFENSFDDRYLELAFVEVSSDGQNFYRFPSSSLTQSQVQTGPFDFTDPTDLHNLAGKYRGGFGTPFDLKDLDSVQGLNLQAVTHVRIVDVVGSIAPSIATHDASGRIINDPFPTPFPSGGFDLDAVAVLQANTLSEVELATSSIDWKILHHILFVNSPSRSELEVELFSLDGRHLGREIGMGTCRIHLGDEPVLVVRIRCGQRFSIIKVLND
ncbi:MAG: T9SS C-terminal target domain-containing protein [Bacteroidota bacterium]|nr:T9SS C-terminal target domain-containing protein [Bacteroidota bacterium]MDX5506518.1 T9SS C-terminal target domain-containing protein [Bacteroidota bacterium]